MRWLTNNGRLLTAGITLLGVSYPFVVYFGLRYFSVDGLLLGLLGLILLRAGLLALRRHWRSCLTTVLVAMVILGVSFIQSYIALLFYPVLISLTLAAAFTLTLIYPPPMIERFARLKTAVLDDYAIRYTRRLTIIWIGFFLINAAIATWTVFAGTLTQWTLYNGFIAYLLIGALFFGEWPVRYYLRRHQYPSDQSVKR